MRKRLLQLYAFGTVLCLVICMLLLPLNVRAEEGGPAGRLVIEVVEEIPADEMDLLEEEEVPLAAFPSDSNKSAGPLPVIMICMAAGLSFCIMYLYRDRERNRLLRQRRQGYRQEMIALHRNSNQGR